MMNSLPSNTCVSRGFCRYSSLNTNWRDELLKRLNRSLVELTHGNSPPRIYKGAGKNQAPRHQKDGHRPEPLFQGFTEKQSCRRDDHKEVYPMKDPPIRQLCPLGTT